MLQSERFSMDVPPERAAALHIRPDMSMHGTDGPLQVGYPNFLYNQSSTHPEPVETRP